MLPTCTTGTSEHASEGGFVLLQVEKHRHLEDGCYVSFFRPTTRRYVGLLSFLYPPSLHTGFCTFTILSLQRDPIWLPPVLYDTHLRATHTTTSSISGVQIPIYLVSNATDSL